MPQQSFKGHALPLRLTLTSELHAFIYSAGSFLLNDTAEEGAEIVLREIKGFDLERCQGFAAGKVSLNGHERWMMLSDLRRSAEPA